MGPSLLLSADVIVTGSAVLRPGWLRIEHGLVAAMGAGRPASPPADDDLGAVTVVPGFVDMHVHGGGGATFADATTDIHHALDFHARHGTTTMVASLVSAQPDALLRQVATMSDATADGLIAGIHLEGPWLAHSHRGAHDASALRDPDPREIDTILAAGRGAVRMVTLAPERDGALDAIRQVVGAGGVAAVGHTGANYERTRRALDAGATVATHLFNAMRPIHQREPGPIVALLEDARVTLELIGDGAHLHPALARLVDRVGPERVALVTDAVCAAGMPDGPYRLGALPVQVLAGVAKVAGSDTLAGSTATMDQLFRRAVAHSEHDHDRALMSAVRQTSINPARALGLNELRLTKDGLAEHAVANLVVLDRKLEVTRVMQRGVWI